VLVVTSFSILNFQQHWLCDKDETIVQTEKKADAITHSKDEIIESNKSLLKEKDIRLKEKENQILGLKGLLSSRGIFEN
jgi:hypothetical protein